MFVHHLGGKFGFEPNRYSIGSLAVAFFFVLSGFILTYVYQNRMNRFADVKSFWFTRFARIWPLHLVCLIIAILTMHSWSSFSSSETWLKLLVNVTLLQSWIPQTDWAFSFNVVSWSISTEAFFYLMFPVLFFSNGRRFWPTTAILMTIVAITAYILHIFADQPSYAHIDFYRIGHVNPLLRIPEFCAGMIAGRIFVTHQKIEKREAASGFNDTVKEVLCVALIVLAAWMFWHYRVVTHITNSDAGSTFLGSWTRVSYPALLFAIVIYVFAGSKGTLSSLVSSRLFIYLGEISYAFYMIHLLVIRYVFHAAISYGELPSWGLCGACLAISIALSIMLYELVEGPAKSSLLSWYKHGYATFAGNFLAKWTVAVLSLRTLIACLLLATSVTVLATNAQRITTNASVQIIVRNSNPELRNVNFGGQMQLLGCQPVFNRNNIELHLAWVKRYDITRRRMVRLLDDYGKQIARGTNNDELIESAEIGKVFVDVVRVKQEKLSRSNRVELQFRDKNKPALLVDRGPRSKRNRGLIVLNKDEIDALFVKWSENR